MIKNILSILLLINSPLFAQTDSCFVLYQIEGKECAYPRLSSDSKSILFQSNQTGKWQIFLMQIADQKQIQITNDTSNNNFPDWSPDNNLIAYVSDKHGNEDIYLLNRKTNELKRITDNAGRDIHPYFSPDGKYILFNSTRGNNSFDIYKYEIETGNTIRITDTREDETCARYSPDMKRIVYLKNGINTDDIYILNISNNVSDNLTKTPYNLDGWPMWSPDGKWIYYSSFINGTYNIYRIRSDGTGREQLTHPAEGEEDARVYITSNQTMIYNKKSEKTIQIMECMLR